MLENSTAIVLQSMVANEVARKFSSDSMSVEVKKSEGRRLSSMQIKALGGSSIQTPSGRSIFGGSGINLTNEIDMKVCLTLYLNQKLR